MKVVIKETGPFDSLHLAMNEAGIEMGRSASIREIIPTFGIGRSKYMVEWKEEQPIPNLMPEVVAEIQRQIAELEPIEREAHTTYKKYFEDWIVVYRKLQALKNSI